MNKNKLYIITLEKIEKRYTSQWYKYFKKEFSKYFIVQYIDGVHGSDEIKNGKFLDINKTNVWKSEQIKELSRLFGNNIIEDGDSFLFMDGWHYGITALKYMSQLNNIKTKIYSYLHAGTWDKHDFISQAGLRSWASNNELGWLTACDCNFVATKFHKKLIHKHFNSYKMNIKVVGFPMDWDKEIKIIPEHKLPRENIVVFPHRVDKEKCPEVFDSMSKSYEFKKVEFIKTIEVTKNKKEYYNLLKKSKITFSANKQETFGIGTVEAMFLGNIPIVPNDLAYVELYDPIFRYNNIRSAKQKISYFMHCYNKDCIQNKLKKNIQKIRNQSLKSIKIMSEAIKNGKR